MTTKKDIERKEKKLDKELEETIELQQKLLNEAREFKEQFADRLLKLVTSAFGLVSALAWNDLIKEAIKVYVKPIFGEESGLPSLLIYAVVITLLAVFVTYQLSKFAEKKN